MRSILDTCVLSEIQRANADERVSQYVAAVDPNDIFLSVITIGEIVNGIEQLAPGRRRDELDRWIRDIEDHHADRILPIDARTAHLWGQISAQSRLKGVTIPAADGLIAATALQHDMTLLTRNTTHFESTGVRLVDPWAD